MAAMEFAAKASGPPKLLSPLLGEDAALRAEMPGPGKAQTPPSGPMSLGRTTGDIQNDAPARVYKSEPMTKDGGARLLGST